MRVFKDLDIVEYLGSGMPCILKAYPKESFIFTANFVRTVFPMDPAALELEEDAGTRKTSAGADEKSSQKSSQKIMHLVRENNTITTTEMAESLGISRRAIVKQIDTLKKEGKLQRIGPDKGGHWEVLDEN